MNPQPEEDVVDIVHFQAFYESWMSQLQDHLQRVVTAPKHHPQINQLHESIAVDLTSHHRAYYTAKWAHQDSSSALLFFSPPWLSPLESAHLWITGWKPSLAVRLVEWLARTRAPLTSLAQMGEDQKRKVEGMRSKVRLEEEKVERDMERKQVALADRRLLELARAAGRREGGGREEEAAVKGVVAGIHRVVKEADMVRLKTLKGLLDVLTPKQGMDFLAVFSMVLLQLRRWGRHRFAT